MSALYERSQLTQVMISSAPATAETMDKAEYLRPDCTIKEVQFTAGQKQDIDVTTLCSTEQENINGLGRRLRFPCRAILSESGPERPA